MEQIEQFLENNEHLDFEDYMILTADVIKNSSFENINPSVIDHLRVCEECNATATNFLVIQNYLYELNKKDKEKESVQKRGEDY